MDLISKIYQNLSNYFSPQEQNIVYPIPAGQRISKGLAYYMGMEQDRQKAVEDAQKRGYVEPTQAPIELKYSPELANAPRQQVKGVSDYLTPTPYPGQNEWANKMYEIDPSKSKQYYSDLYKKAVTTKGFTGNYYGVTPTPTPIPGMEVIPGGTDLAMKYIQSQTPQGQDPYQYYPALADKGFVDQINSADKMRQGLANLLLLMAFQESTLGRGSSNIFGVKPGGNVSEFNSPQEALNYQLSENVLGGGATPAMNVLASNKPLTLNDVSNLYKSYDPPGAYIDALLKILRQGGLT